MRMKNVPPEKTTSTSTLAAAIAAEKSSHI
jgi:hypothetical protein